MVVELLGTSLAAIAPWAVGIVAIIMALGGGKGIASILTAVLGIAVFIWVLSTLGPTLAVIVAVFLAILWLILKK